MAYDCSFIIINYRSARPDGFVVVGSFESWSIRVEACEFKPCSKINEEQSNDSFVLKKRPNNPYAYWASATAVLHPKL